MSRLFLLKKAVQVHYSEELSNRLFDIEYSNYHDVYLAPIQLVSLSKLVEAIICYDKIVTDAKFYGTWSGSEILKLVIDEGVITTLDIDETAREELDKESGRKTFELLKSSVFEHFVNRLIQETPEGCILKVAQRYSGSCIDEYDYFGSHDTTDSFGAIRSHSSDLWFEERKESELAQAISMFVTGAFYYRSLSAFFQIPYSPFCLRTPFCIYVDSRYGLSPISGANIAMRIMKNETVAAIQSTLNPDNLFLVELNIPNIFAYILKRAEDPIDIINSALQIRNTDEAKDFRQEISKLTNLINAGNIPSALQIVDQIKQKASRILQTETKILESKLKIGFGGIEIELPLNVAKTLSTFTKRKKGNFLSSVVV